MCPAPCWAALGRRAQSHVGLPGGGDGRDPRHLGLGTRAGAGPGLRETQGLHRPKEKRREPAALGPWTPRGAYPKRHGGNNPAVCSQSLSRLRGCGDERGTDGSGPQFPHLPNRIISKERIRRGPEGLISSEDVECCLANG